MFMMHLCSLLPHCMGNCTHYSLCEETKLLLYCRIDSFSVLDLCRVFARMLLVCARNLVCTLNSPSYVNTAVTPGHFTQPVSPVLSHF